MATTRFFGKIGYNLGAVEEEPGVYVENIEERSYFGDVLDNSRQLDSDDKINSDLSVRNSISIVADEFAFTHFHAIRYLEWAGAKWIVKDIQVKSPRLVLRLGGVYNG